MRMKHKLQVFENSVLNKIFGLKRKRIAVVKEDYQIQKNCLFMQ
jgi:hypothetical protein